MSFDVAVVDEESEFQRWYALATEIERKCTRCGKTYLEINNLGTCGCRYHPGLYNYFGKGDHYDQDHFDCCGLQHSNPYEKETFETRLPYGCTPADHTVKEAGASYIEDDNLHIPLECVSRIPTKGVDEKKETRVVDLKNSKLIIKRFDVKEAEYRIANGQPSPATLEVK